MADEPPASKSSGSTETVGAAGGALATPRKGIATSPSTKRTRIIRHSALNELAFAPHHESAGAVSGTEAGGLELPRHKQSLH